MGSNKKGRSGVPAPKRPTNKGEFTPTSTYSQCKTTTRKRKFQARSNADALAAERDYVSIKNNIPLNKRGKDPETWHNLNDIRERVGADGEYWP